MAGLLAHRLADLGLAEVNDRRSKRGRRWRIEAVLAAAIAGLMAGCRSLAEIEVLTEKLGSAARSLLGIARRLPDTTLRDNLCAVGWRGLVAALHRLVHAAHRRKALEPEGLPFGVVAVDGKSTMLPCWDDEYVQRVQPEGYPPYGLLRTVTCALVSARGRPCIHIEPLPAATNEMGHFEHVWRELLGAHGQLFQVVTADAGPASEHNAATVVADGKDYLFTLADERRLMRTLARDLLASKQPAITTEEVLDNQTSVIRRLYIAPVYDHSKRRRESLAWSHTRSLLRLETVIERHGATERRERYFNSSLTAERLTPAEWLQLIRAHWGVENNNHHTLDAVFREDEQRWITADGRGALAVVILRRLAYTILTLFRSVTQRSEEARAMRWRDLLDWVYDTLIVAGPEHLAGLRRRAAACA
jgi:hypothetical protein